MLPSDKLLLSDGILEFYDNYMDQENPIPAMSLDRVGTWNQSNLASRSRSRSVANTQYAPSSYSGRPMRTSSKRSNPRSFVRARSNYEEEEEEGYGSGEYDDGPIELNLIRVKVCSLFIFCECFLISFG